jgi:hypothetical protein
MRSCGGCTSCCDFMGIDELGKAPLCVCPHRADGGCSIYESRPGSCRAFTCVWLLEDIAEKLRLREEDRPDRSGILITSDGEFPAFVAWEVWPGAHAQYRAQKLLKRVTAKTLLVVYPYGRNHESLPVGPPAQVQRFKRVLALLKARQSLA